MITIEIFPKNVQEVFDFWFHGDILFEPYKKDIQPELLIKDIHVAIELYTNQDVEPPLFFLQDIVSIANGSIPPPGSSQKKMVRSLIEFSDGIDFNIILDKVKSIKESTNANDHIVDVIAGSIAEYVYAKAKSRLLLSEPQPFFEKLFLVLKNQGYPCAWKGEENCYNGDFVIYSR